MDDRIAGKSFHIPKLGVRRKHDAIFLYDRGFNRCAVCGGVGFAWHGWFNCDDCDAIALIASGETFVRMET